MRWTVPPDPLNNATLPFAPTGAMTRFGTLWAFTKFRFDAVGRADPSPNTVTYPPPVGAVTVTFNTTAATPEAGTPPRPATCRCTVPPAGTAALAAPTPARVSNNRAGASDANPPAADTAAAAAAGARAEALTGAKTPNAPASPIAH